MSYGKKSIHQDDRNVTIRTLIGQIDDSTIAYENESIEIDGPDEPMIVNTSETADGTGSAVDTTNQRTPVQIPNTAQTQSIGVSTILSTSRGLDPNQVEPHVIQDRPPTRNITDLVTNLAGAAVNLLTHHGNFSEADATAFFGTARNEQITGITMASGTAAAAYFAD